MRQAGILLPITSLPSPHGVGTLGASAYSFVDFLSRAGQHFWQILPVHPTGYGDSPYQSFSAFAGNPYLIDLDLLIQNGLLTKEEADEADKEGAEEGRVNYDFLFRTRLSLLRRAFERFPAESEEFHSFCTRQSEWLHPYALFMSLKDLHGGAPFWEWPEKYRLRRAEALADFLRAHERDVDFYKFLQFLFFSQWQALRQHAAKQGVSLIGDLPIYVAADSADLWAGRSLFLLDEQDRPDMVAGCPPDAFSESGQLWGNPLYRWDYHKATDYRWWINRLRAAGTLVDIVRIDHFRGFESFYAIPAEAKSAREGRWLPGPGSDFISAVKSALPDLSIIAEDLGFLTEEVYRLLRESEWPGMKVLQFAFDGDAHNSYLPHHHTENAVVYTGTHDNPTLLQWQQSLSPGASDFVRAYFNLSEAQQPADALIRAALASVCRLAIIPMGDWLSLGKEGRINRPSSVRGNWCWRLRSEQLSEDLASRIARLTRLYGR